MASLVTHRPRHPGIAVLLSLIGSPVSGMLYLGKGTRAIAYAVLVVACLFLSYELAKVGLWVEGVSWYWVYLLVVLAGAFDAYRLAQNYAAAFTGPWFATWQGLVGIAIAYGVLSLGIRSALFEPFRIPAASMLPTLEIGDHFFVNKFSYGLRLPFTSVELTAGEAPARGDVIVFRPADQRVAYIKRIVGLPGDTIEIDAQTKELTINGQGVALEVVESLADGQLRARETLGQRQHELLINPAVRTLGGVYEVPAGHFFVLGDNRDNSMDSRFQDLGFIAEDEIVGRASRVWWNSAEPERAGVPL